MYSKMLSVTDCAQTNKYNLRSEERDGLAAGSRLNRMGSDPAALTRTPVSAYGRGLCGALTAQHCLASLGEDKGDVVINYLPAGQHLLCNVLRPL